MENTLNKWKILLAAGCMVALANLATTIVNIALPSITNELNIGLGTAQWIINGYFLSSAIFFVIGGKLSQIYGKKIIFLIGVILFLLSSIVAGITDNYLTLIFSRIVQGIGFAFTLSLAVIMATLVFPEHQRGLATGIIVTITGFSQAIGPFMGGLMLNYLSWHWIFLVNIPFCVIAFWFIYGEYPRDTRLDKDTSFDWVGSILFGIGLTIFLYGLNTVHSNKLSLTLTELSIGALFIASFLFKQSKPGKKLIRLSIFRTKDFSLTLVARSTYMYGWAVLLFVVPLYLQNILSLTPMQSGLCIFSMSVMIGVLSPLVGHLVDKIGYKSPIFLSMTLSSFCFLLMYFIPNNTSFIFLIFILFTYGISASLNIPSTMNAVITSLDTDDISIGTGVFFTLMFVSASLAVAVSAGEMNYIANHYLSKAVESYNLAISSPNIQILDQIVTGTKSINAIHNFQITNASELITIAKKTYFEGFKIVMFTSLLLSILGTIASLKLNSRRKSKG